MLDTERIVLPGQIYQHFKNKLYQIITIAEHSEDGSRLVIYQQLYGEYKIYARPYEMFISEVDHLKYPDVKQKYRFECVSDIYKNNNEQKNISSNEHLSESIIHNDILDDSSSDKHIEEKCMEKDKISENKSFIHNEDEEMANPILLEFLDADTFEQKRNLVVNRRNSLTDRLIDDIAASMDVIVENGDIDSRFKSLLTCIEMQMKFEIKR